MRRLSIFTRKLNSHCQAAPSLDGWNKELCLLIPTSAAIPSFPIKERNHTVTLEAARYRESVSSPGGVSKKLPLQTKPVIDLLLVEAL